MLVKLQRLETTEGGMGSKRIEYGPDLNQYGQLYLPAERVHAGVVVIIHGGYWRARYGAELGVPLAEDLAERGWCCWNLEYRRVGNGGGWPETFEDIAAGIDKLAQVALEEDLDLNNIVALGHSAGGHLATWAASRGSLPTETPGAGTQVPIAASQGRGRPQVPVTAVVAQSGLLDIRAAFEASLSDGAVAQLLGGTPQQYPFRYHFADPLRQVPLPVPAYAVHAADDITVPISQTQAYVSAATAAGAEAELIEVPGDHFDLIDIESEAFAQCRYLLERAFTP